MRSSEEQLEPLWLPPVLQTPRLTLRPLSLEDAPSIFAYAQNPEVARYTMWEPHKSLEDSFSTIKDYAFSSYAKKVPEPLGITFKESPDRVIGTVGCFWVSESSKCMELAYALAQEHWGKGLAAEASRCVMKHCFQEYSLKRIQARCKAENTASSRVMEKAGMSYEGTLKSALFHNDRYWDVVYYAQVKP